jgi:hypothetical protein
MNKKLIAMTTSLVIGGSLLFGTAYANASQLSGYEAFKASIKDTKSLKNETADLKVSINDNGSDLVYMTSNFKINSSANTRSEVTTVKTSSGSQTFSTYRQDGKNISKDSSSDVYTVMENNKNFNKKDKAENPELQKSIEVVIDTLVGNMKDKVTVTDNGDGTKKSSISLNENEVTPLANALTSMALVRSSDKQMHNDKKAELANLKNVIPQLQSDIKVKSVDVTGDINKDNTIKDEVAKIVITGTDAQGKAHEITVNVNLDLSNINSTTPDTVDLTGKQVKTITPQSRGAHND